jgi:5-methylcytosine-specific restriction endonuclease McrA
VPRKSTGQYPPNWPEIARQVKEAAGWRCIRCGHPDDTQAGYMLGVHHLDLDKSNCAWWNLLALCQRCHLRIQAKVILERPWMFTHSEWFRPYAAGFYAHQAGVRDDREYVMEHLWIMLAVGQPWLFPPGERDF